jgi:oligopeptide transport system ATP-binding protein
MSDVTNVLEVNNLTKAFVSKRDMYGRARQRTHAVRGVSFDVERGKTVAVVGESGAGKSTVGRLLLRLTEPDGGTVQVSGVDMLALNRGELRKMRAKARMIFQDPYSSLDPMMTIGEAVAEELTYHNMGTRSERRERAAAMLGRVGLSSHHLTRFPHEFSGGQLQRIAVARALITNPDLIVCDEPVAALDMSIRAQVINLLTDLQQEFGVGYVFISHDLSLVRLIADKIIVMKDGQIVESGNAEEVFTDPQHDYTKLLLSSIPMLKTV